MELREAPGLTCKKKCMFPNLNTDCSDQSALRDFESMSSSKESQVLFRQDIHNNHNIYIYIYIYIFIYTVQYIYIYI